MYLFCHMILHDQLIDRSCKYMCGSSVKYVTTLVSLVNIGIMAVFLFCHVTSRKHIFIGL